MKSTGIVRKVDELGRIVLPIELRRTLGIEEKDRIEIFVEGESVILRKYQPACIFCDNAKDLILYKGKNICPDCIRSMVRQNQNRKHHGRHHSDDADWHSDGGFVAEHPRLDRHRFDDGLLRRGILL